MADTAAAAETAFVTELHTAVQLPRTPSCLLLAWRPLSVRSRTLLKQQVGACMF